MKIVNKMSRSVFGFSYPVKGSFNLGEICPIGAPIEVIPYDEFNANCAIVIRMATPIAPIMDDLDAEITAHFVPLRLVGNKNTDYTNMGYATSQTSFTNFQRVIGNGYGNPADWSRTTNEAYTAPTAAWNAYNARSAGYTTIGEALGLGLGCGTSANQNVLAYPLFGYNLIYQERFRNQDVETAQPNLARGSNINGVSGSNTDTSGTDETYNHALSVAYKHGDRITNAKPSPTKGAAVVIPLAGEAKLKTIGSSTIDAYTFTSGTTKAILANNAFSNGSIFSAGITGNLVLDTSATTGTSPSDITKTNIYADLSTATSATVNQFIEAYNIQSLLMTDIKGTRYYDLIKNHYGVENDDIRLYIPELLNIRRFQINVSPVVQQSGSSASTSATDQDNYLGTTGGYSFTADKSSLVHHAFGEFGYIYFLIVIRQKHTYGQGIPTLYKRSKRFDFFWPELGRIGYQELPNSFINADATTGIYGYEPAWEELRRVNESQVFGLLNPAKANSLDYWTLAENRTSTPTLNMAYLKENRTNLARALCIADQGPDFIMDAVIYGKKSTLVPIGDTPKLFK